MSEKQNGNGVAVIDYLKGRRARLERALQRVEAKAEGIGVELESLNAKIKALEDAAE